MNEKVSNLIIYNAINEDISVGLGGYLFSLFVFFLLNSERNNDNCWIPN